MPEARPRHKENRHGPSGHRHPTASFLEGWGSSRFGREAPTFLLTHFLAPTFPLKTEYPGSDPRYSIWTAWVGQRGEKLGQSAARPLGGVGPMRAEGRGGSGAPAATSGAGKAVLVACASAQAEYGAKGHLILPGPELPNSSHPTTTKPNNNHPTKTSHHLSSRTHAWVKSTHTSRERGPSNSQK